MKCYEKSHDNTVFTQIEHVVIVHSYLKFLNPLKYSTYYLLLTNTLIFVYLHTLPLLANGHSSSEMHFTSKINKSSEN